MAIDTGNILNVSASEYCESQNTTLAKYDLFGVHYEGDDLEGFAKLVPDNAEVVVNYQHSFFGGSSFSMTKVNRAMGTALILKTKRKP
jgi:hypothetical protein